MLNLEQIYKENGAFLQGHFLLSSGKHSGFYLQSAKILEFPHLANTLCAALGEVINAAKVEFDSICSPALGGILAGYELARVCKKRFIFTERVGGVMSLRRGFAVAKGEKFIICEDIITTGGSALESAKIIENLGGEVVGFAALANRGFCKVSNLNSTPKGGDLGFQNEKAGILGENLGDDLSSKNENSSENLGLNNENLSENLGFQNETAKISSENLGSKNENTKISSENLASKNENLSENGENLSGNSSKAKLPQNLPLFALGNFEFEIYEPSECPFCKSGSVAIKPGSRGN